MKKLYGCLSALLLLLAVSLPALAGEAAAPVWSAEPAGVVQVDENGGVTALAPGTAVVTVSWNGTERSITVTVEALPCEFGDHDITSADDLKNHAQAICGVPGHCASEPGHSEEPLDRFCPSEPQHRVCEAGATHLCDGEYGCGELYPCEESGRHTECAVCGRPWCYAGTEEAPVSHETLPCGHRACDPESAGHDELPCGEHYACQTPEAEHKDHDTLACGTHYACQVAASEQKNHAKLPCGHASCDASAGKNHDKLACGAHYACQVAANEQKNHTKLPCGHASCDASAGSNHQTLVCDVHYACMVPVNQYGNHALMDCGHALCTASSGEDHTAKLACGLHYACQVPADKHGSHVKLSCGHTACSVDPDSDHARGACGHFLCDGLKHDLCAACGARLCNGANHGACSLCGEASCVGAHGSGLCVCPACNRSPSHALAACGAHRTCEAGEHLKCVCGGFLCLGDHSGCAVSDDSEAVPDSIAPSGGPIAGDEKVGKDSDEEAVGEGRNDPA